MSKTRNQQRYQAFRSGKSQPVMGPTEKACWDHLLRAYGPDMNRANLRMLGWTVKEASE